MRATCQIICYFVTLLALLLLGGCFDIAIRQTDLHVRLLGGMPLPRITVFLIDHDHLPARPFIPFYYGVMADSHESAIEFATRFVFRGGVCAIAAAAVLGFLRRRRS